MEPIPTHQELWGVPFPINGEWDAGLTPVYFPHQGQGRWTVRRERERFVLVFYNFHTRRETLLDTFPPDEAGEVAATTAARRLVDQAYNPTQSQNKGAQ